MHTPETNRPLSSIALAALISRCTGVPVTGDQVDDAGQSFAELGVDSLGLLGVVAQLQRDCGLSETVDLNTDHSPRDLLLLLDGRA
ncbi:Phosphopantetheine attachment site [Saccharopolyspora kobensis]|uniref:Minimal PKS acyl carrier protein n=2 Tax=Saccharopolyspora kobensis TaxID=146035 RepID=A0A1H5V0S9_9PSEU|nr:acyl carrier protein [Saccharopolyspora kobensis]SEF80278.1 Phosphopantetheine attachment site [Saccharopolyspora kobensis]SFC67338.1 minimal PKS acyl carrier protein [Saccharopolyspora kobensis]